MNLSYSSFTIHNVEKRGVKLTNMQNVGVNVLIFSSGTWLEGKTARIQPNSICMYLLFLPNIPHWSEGNGCVQQLHDVSIRVRHVLLRAPKSMNDGNLFSQLPAFGILKQMFL